MKTRGSQRERAMAQLSPPPDLQRRLRLAAQLRRTGAQPTAAAAAESGPPEALARLPRAAAAFVALPAERLEKSAAQLVEAHGQLDAPVLSEQARSELNIPQAATAVSVARAQARALAALPPALSRRFPAGAAWIWEQVGKHSELMSVVPGVSCYLSGLAIGRLAHRAARGHLRQLLDSYVQGMLATLSREDPEHARLSAFVAPLEQMRARKAQAEEEGRHKAAQARARALEVLAEVQAEQQLAEVWRKLRAGEVPEYAALLQAARYFRGLRDRRGARRE